MHVATGEAKYLEQALEYLDVCLKVSRRHHMRVTFLMGPFGCVFTAHAHPVTRYRRNYSVRWLIRCVCVCVP